MTSGGAQEQTPFWHTMKHRMIKMSTKVTLSAVLPVIFALAVSLVTLLVMQRKLQNDVNVTIRKQADSEASKVAKAVYSFCVATHARNTRALDRQRWYHRWQLTYHPG